MYSLASDYKEVEGDMPFKFFMNVALNVNTLGTIPITAYSAPVMQLVIECDECYSKF